MARAEITDLASCNQQVGLGQTCACWDSNGAFNSEVPAARQHSVEPGTTELRGDRMRGILGHLRHQVPFDQLDSVALREQARLHHRLILVDAEAVKRTAQSVPKYAEPSQGNSRLWLSSHSRCSRIGLAPIGRSYAIGPRRLILSDRPRCHNRGVPSSFYEEAAGNLQSWLLHIVVK